MKIKYANEFVQQLGMVDNTTCVYWFIYNWKKSSDKYIIQYFIMHWLGLFIKVYIYVEYIFYAC